MPDFSISDITSHGVLVPLWCSLCSVCSANRQFYTLKVSVEPYMRCACGGGGWDGALKGGYCVSTNSSFRHLKLDQPSMSPLGTGSQWMLAAQSIQWQHVL